MKVELIKDSIANGVRICTFILEYPRFIHAEFMTHRVFSRNSASSRAIPTKAIIQQLREDPADIVWWGKQMSGMQAKEQLTGFQLWAAKAMWKLSMNIAIFLVQILSLLGLHKQLANRMLETFQNIRVVVTSTEWNNFLALRNHPDAQPEIAALAKRINELLEISIPDRLYPGDWHIPYIWTFTRAGKQHYSIDNDTSDPGNLFTELTLDQALKVSASLAAQESYRKSDSSLEKAEAIFARLVESKPVHASPTEHQAQAMLVYTNQHNLHPDDWEIGITHVDRNNKFWSGNFRSWIQHRQLIPNHHVPG